ncbi:MAG: MaoC family dehydratase [Gammaproteobacteria bacterium]|nr:MaoC family dehydratase [Gammaproteobacteria bacterium]MCY4357869.1 MaoC family dehydratase [Gammaproteobacteria bacterium]
MTETQYFEDLEVGHVDEYGEYEVTAEEIIEFASKYDPQPFHLSEEAGKAMIFGGLCASGWHTCSMAMRMLVDNMPSPSASLGSPGVDELRWLKPVFPGDWLRVKSTVIDKRQSRSRPDMGSVFMSNEVFNQHGDVVLSFRPIVMYRRRSHG